MSLTLSVVEIIRHLLYLLRCELDILLLKRFAPLAEVDKQHLILTVAVEHHLAILLHRACLAVACQYLEGNADVCKRLHRKQRALKRNLQGSESGGYLFSHNKCSTIGVAELNDPVRNGKGWDLSAITT